LTLGCAAAYGWQEFDFFSNPEVPMAATASPLLTRDEASVFLKLKPATLAAWASRRKHLKYIMVGGRAMYRIAELEKWLQRREVKCDSDAK
jgi:hypothetical protein